MWWIIKSKGMFLTGQRSITQSWEQFGGQGSITQNWEQFGGQGSITQNWEQFLYGKGALHRAKEQFGGQENIMQKGSILKRAKKHPRKGKGVFSRRQENILYTKWTSCCLGGYDRWKQHQTVFFLSFNHNYILVLYTCRYTCTHVQDWFHNSM